MPHRPGVLTTQEIQYLTTGPVRSVSVGQIQWSVSHPRLGGLIDVETPLEGDRRIGKLQLLSRSMKPDEPSLQYLVGGVAAVRFDVNGKHNGWERCDHLHWYRPDGSEHSEPKLLGASLARGGHPSSDDYRRVFEAFAEYLQIELREPWWQPWRGRWEPWTP